MELERLLDKLAIHADVTSRVTLSRRVRILMNLEHLLVAFTATDFLDVKAFDVLVAFSSTPKLNARDLILESFNAIVLRCSLHKRLRNATNFALCLEVGALQIVVEVEVAHHDANAAAIWTRLKAFRAGLFMLHGLIERTSEVAAFIVALELD